MQMSSLRALDGLTFSLGSRWPLELRVSKEMVRDIPSSCTPGSPLPGFSIAGTCPLRIATFNRRETPARNNLAAVACPLPPPPRYGGQAPPSEPRARFPEARAADAGWREPTSPARAGGSSATGRPTPTRGRSSRPVLAHVRSRGGETP